MSLRNEYPATVCEILDDKMKFRPAALTAVRRFARCHPWLGSTAERRLKFERLLDDLSNVYGIPRPRLVIDGLDGSDSSRSCYLPSLHTIILRGFSVVTLLHEFCHARGMGEYDAVAYSVNLYRRIWPRLFARCQHQGHLLRSPSHYCPVEQLAKPRLASVNAGDSAHLRP